MRRIDQERGNRIACRSDSIIDSDDDSAALWQTYAFNEEHTRLQPFELFVGLRYTRAKRRNHFISFISLISMLGIALGVAALITVLSVMNGFQKELRSRILGVASHVQISGIDNTLAGWQKVAADAK